VLEFERLLGNRHKILAVPRQPVDQSPVRMAHRCPDIVQRHAELDEFPCGLSHFRGGRGVHHGAAVDTGEDAQDAAFDSLAQGLLLPNAGRKPR
jgi:hypothetical protein